MSAVNDFEKCSNCWQAAGTQRESSRKHVLRTCRHSGLHVIVAGKNVGSCSFFQERPSNATIADKANAAASTRINAINEGK
jgi:hypothetical protein